MLLSFLSLSLLSHEDGMVRPLGTGSDMATYLDDIFTLIECASENPEIMTLFKSMTWLIIHPIQ